jgi:hypothetical protein
VKVIYLVCNTCKIEEPYSLEPQTREPNLCGSAKNFRIKCKQDLPCSFSWQEREQELTRVDCLKFGLDETT